jgi:RecA-family ATPase
MTDLGNLRRREFPEREDIVGPWLRQGESAMLWAPVGLGKSMLAMTIALAVAGGGKACGWTFQRPRPVLLLDGEMHVEDVRDRLVMLAATVDGLDMKAADRNLTVLCRQDQTPDVKFPDLATAPGRTR